MLYLNFAVLDLRAYINYHTRLLKKNSKVSQMELNTLEHGNQTKKVGKNQCQRRKF